MVHIAVHLLAVAAVAGFASATEYIFDPDAFVPGVDPSTNALQAPSQRNSRRGFMTSFDESNMCGTVDTSQARELCRQIVRHCERQVADFCEQDSACEGKDDRTTLGFRCFVEAVDDPGFYEIMGRTAEGGEWYRPSACGLSFLFKDFLRPKDLPFFMCLADKKSEYYPRQFNKHHGIFGLGSQWGWCRAENPEEQKDVRYISCEIDCKDTHDLHLKDDLVCVFKILHFKGIDGFGKEVFPRCCSSYAAKSYSPVELCGSKYATDDYLIEDEGRGDDSKFGDLPNVCLVGPVAGFDYPKLWNMKAFERFPERVEAERELLKQGNKVLAPAGFDSTPMKEYPGLMGGSSRRRRDSPSSGEGKAEVKSAVSEYVFNPDNFIPGADPSTTSLNRLPLYGYMNAFKENYMCGNVGDDQARELCRQIVRHCQKQVADFCGQDEGAACTGKGDKIQLSWRCFLDAVEDPGFYEVMGRSAGLSLFRDVHPCALYNLMKEYVRPEDIPFFLCLINTKSTFDHRKSDHGEFHGLFGLGSDYGWCRKDDSWQRDNQIDIKCNLPCKDTYDLHLKDDLRCVFNVLEYLGIEEGFGPEVYHKCCSLHDYKSFNPVDICQSKYATNDYPEEEGRAADKLPVPNMCLIDEGRDFDYERIWQEPALANVASRFWTERTMLRRGHNVYTPAAFGTTPMKNYVNIMKNVATARAGKALPEFETSEEDKDLSLFEDAGRRRRRSLSSEDEESFAEAEAESGAFSRHRRSFAEAEAEAEAESGAFTRRRRSFAEAEAEAEAESGAFSRRRRSSESFAEAEAEAEAESFPQRRRRSSGWAQSEGRSRSRRSTSDDEGNYDDYDQEDDEDENESAVWSNPRSGKSSSEIVEDDDDYEYTEERHTPGYEDYDTNNVKRIGKSKVSSVNPDEYVFNDEYNESLEDDDAYYPDSDEKYGKRKGKNDGETEDGSDTSPNIDLSDIILTIPVSVPSTPDNVEVGSRRRRAAKPGIFTPKERCAIILDPVEKAKYPGQVCDDERVRVFLMEETLDSLSTVL